MNAHSFSRESLSRRTIYITTDLYYGRELPALAAGYIINTLSRSRLYTRHHPHSQECESCLMMCHTIESHGTSSTLHDEHISKVYIFLLFNYKIFSSRVRRDVAKSQEVISTILFIILIPAIVADVFGSLDMNGV